MARPKKHKQQPNTSTITLSDEAFNTIQEAIGNPPEPNEALLEAVQSLKENGIALEPPKTALDSISEETLPSVSPEEENGVNANTEPSEGIVNPQETIELNITKSDLGKLIEEVLYVSSLGGDIVTRHLPRLGVRPPFIRMSLPKLSEEAYNAREGYRVEVDGEKYNEFILSSVDPLIFIREVIDAGKRGGILKKGKAKFVGVYSCHILIKNVLEVGPNARALGEQIEYTSSELQEFSLFDLKLIGE
jgi:hypothetical protein